MLGIGELSRKTGVRIETIRYYERIGLLAPPARTAGNYRRYRETDAGRLRFIRRARALGFPIDRIGTLLALADQRDRSCEDVDAIARDHLDEIDRKIADLTALRRELASMVDACSSRSIARCRILGALASDR
ncbi:MULTISPECIES: helix-turn-helix domain-containing protein [Acidiphilium]|uniref:MerR family transcriptional regulator n=1 Tax=Acidiphilium TaxID=522 RepID=UPI000214551E|nr:MULTISPECIES: helix-turn-helix domain-containing protein [Acidiphilium]EGO94822.1 MerR family transcriptional regulator [Acidiphilium sp. PM]MBU6355862.1 helix-turn-helix domain-containing protein [Rhodospirillales bacterium]UNC12807.1 helix-turn-helix domain-containing protein [Acidiphilium multivorum]